MSDNDALHALLRLQRKLIGRGSGASCCTDAKIVKIREDFKTIKDTLANLVAERDEARRMYCKAVADHYEYACNAELDGAGPYTQQDTAKDEGWDCFKEDGK